MSAKIYQFPGSANNSTQKQNEARSILSDSDHDELKDYIVSSLRAKEHLKVIVKDLVESDTFYSNHGPMRLIKDVASIFSCE